MLKASIDIGSHSVLLLIAEVQDKHITPVLERIFYPRLGKGLANSGKLADESMRKAEDTLKAIMSICEDKGLSKENIIAGATAAIRDAINGGEFTDHIKHTLDLNIRIIPCHEEAELTYRGAVSQIDSEEPIAVLDVGGGSSECTSGVGTIAMDTLSVPIGAVKMLDRFGKNTGLVPDAVELMERELGSIAKIARKKRLIGVGGTITTLAAVALEMESYDSELISSVVFTQDNFRELIDLFRNRTLKEIAMMPGMEPQRADIIEAGTTIILTFMELAEAKTIEVSPRGLRYGLLI